MKTWSITRFDSDESPHWDTAIIEAETAEDAVKRLDALLCAGLPETVWNPRPWQEWKVREFDGEFVLGGGCR